MSLKDDVYLGNANFYEHKLRVLARDELQPEKWSMADRADFGILKNYLRYTYEKLEEERNTALDEEKNKYILFGTNNMCFNTGLYDKTWQPIYFCCEPNPRIGYQPWQFKNFHNSYTVKYSGIPPSAIQELRRPNYFTDPGKLIFNVNLKIIPQWRHILYDEENFQRIPAQLREYGKEFCQSVIQSSIETVTKRIEANYKTTVPQWHKGKIQLLAPLFLLSQEKPDLALVLSPSEDNTQYYGHTCLTMEMAYNNARLIARPESYWLQP